MSTFAVDEPPQENNQQPSPSPSMFSSLPNEIVLEVLARAPPRNYPILSCVSKKFRNLVRSPEIYKIRSLLGKDSLYICFLDETKSENHPQDCFKWFTLRRIENNNKTENRFASVDLEFPYHDHPNPSVIAVGPEIFFICGSYIPSSSLYIFDSRSGKLRRGPCMQVNREFKSVGLVGGKVFVIGGFRNDEIEAESFDLKKQIWEKAPIPEEKRSRVWIGSPSVSLDRKVYALSFLEEANNKNVYDTRDGSCESFKMPDDLWWKTGVCTIHNVLYVYFAGFGLMWYDSNLKLWSEVLGLRDLSRVRSVAMAEYYGKLAFLWEEEKARDVSSQLKTIWYRMIGLARSEEGIQGTAESSQLLGIVPRCYQLYHCLSVSV